MSELITDRQEVLRIIADDGDEAVQCRHVEGAEWQPVYYAWLKPELFQRLQWRRKPAPKRVPLAPVDVPPGSVVRHIGQPDWRWHHIGVGAYELAVYGFGNASYSQLMTEFQISRDGGKTWHGCWREEA
jgi:hypothetical protein